MTEHQHPVTPPPELVQQWVNQWHQAPVKHVELEDFVATQAARWGADQQLNADCEWMQSHFHGMSQWSEELRAAMRPKPPSLAEPALEQLKGVENLVKRVTGGGDLDDTIRAALERLQELEKGNA